MSLSNGSGEGLRMLAAPPFATLKAGEAMMEAAGRLQLTMLREGLRLWLLPLDIAHQALRPATAAAERAPAPAPEEAPAEAAPIAAPAPAPLGPPPADLAAADEEDDLEQINGIGPKLRLTLRDLGVSRYHQIAAWTPEEVASINRRLGFRGRIERERWQSQAAQLAGGPLQTSTTSIAALVASGAIAASGE